MAESKAKKPATEVAEVNPAEINTHEGELNEVEYTIEYQKKNGAVIPVIDGVEHPELLMGYTSEADMKAGLEVLKSALKATGGDIYQAMHYMYNAAMNTAKDIHPNTQVDIDDVECMVDCAAKKIYTLERVELANLEDLSEEVLKVLNDEAIIAMLTDRARARIAEMKLEVAEGELNYWEDEDDEW